MFVLGALIGVYFFGESVGHFEPFYLSTYFGRFTIQEMLGLPAGVAVLLVVMMALLMFWGAEIAEAYFGQKRAWSEIRLLPQSKGKILASLALVTACLVMIGRGQPTPEQRWSRMGAAGENLVSRRAVFVHPAEVVDLRKDLSLSIRIFDVRDERDYNLFHISDSARLSPGEVYQTALVKNILDNPDNVISFIVSNGERAALKAWKALKAQGVVNLYIIEGGINRWLDLYPLPECVARKRKVSGIPDGEALRYRFDYAVGSRLDASHPELEPDKKKEPCPSTGQFGITGDNIAAARHTERPTYQYVKKVVLQKKRAVKGGCG
jgi:rhodanese-related sulfurtransferase